MKRTGRLAYGLLSFTMFLSATACPANKGSLYVQSPSFAGETQLPAGEYTLEWEGHGPQVELKIKRGNRVQATVPATVIPLDQPSKLDAAVLDIDGNGSQALSEIRFSGKKFFLRIAPPVATTTLPPEPCPECECGSP
jgi:hypothetical protein